MIVSIASGKGGTGKTTLSVNLAKFLTDVKHFEVTLADLDVEEPNSNLFLNLTKIQNFSTHKSVPEWNEDLCSLCERCQDRCRFNSILKISNSIIIFPEMCHSCFLCSDLCVSDALKMKKIRIGEINHHKEGRFNFVEGRLDTGQEMPTPQIKQTIEYVKSISKNKITIFDAPPGTSCSMVEVTKNSDFVILVSEPTAFGLYDLKLAVETVRDLQKPFAVVINKYGIGDEKIEKYCRNESIDIISRIPHSINIAKKYSRGELIYDLPEVNSELHKIVQAFPEEKL
ncbi:MAG: P-loop NTPase [Rhodothermaceae bacterium]